MALYSINAGDIALVTWFGRLDSQVIMNTFHYKWTAGFTGTDGPAELGALVTKIKTNVWTGEWKTPCSNNYSLERIQGQIIYPTRRVYMSTPVGESGAGVSTGLPSFTQACITRYGSIAGRGRSASLQLAGLNISLVTGSVLNDAALATIQGVADQLPVILEDIDATGPAWTPVNWTIGKAAEFNPVRGATVQRAVRTEKRRVVGQGI